MLVFHNEIGELGPHLNLKPALGGRQIRGIEAAPTAARGSGEQGQSWRLLGEGKDSQEVNLREMYSPQQAWSPDTEWAARFLPSNPRFHQKCGLWIWAACPGLESLLFADTVVPCWRTVALLVRQRCIWWVAH